MIKLDAIASRSVDGSLQTARTMTPVTGVAFMTVKNDDSQAVNIRQGFVPFQALVNVVNPLPQPVGIEHRMDSSRVSALKVGSSSQRFQKWARPSCSQALMLPNLAQNSTSDDFTTAAVEMRGFSLRSETCVTISLESWKIFSARSEDHTSELQSPCN